MRTEVQIQVTIGESQPLALGLVSSLGGRSPFAFGHIFKKGHFPESVVSDLGDFQWVTKSRWSDGSVKIGQCAGIVDLQPGVQRKILLLPGQAQSTPTLVPEGLSGLICSIEVDGHPAAQWSDWSQPYEQWISGPQMSSWLYFKRLDDTWLTAWLEIRLFADGRIAVLPSLENGYVRAPGRGLQSGRVRFSMNGEVRYDSVRTAWIYDHARYILAENADGWHWSDDPRVFPRHDTGYMMGTGLVPYYPFAPPDSQALLGMQQKIIPFTFVDQKRRPEADTQEEFHGVANMPTPWRSRTDGWKLQGGIGAGGYHASIGVLPHWDASFLTSGGHEYAYRAMLANHQACCLGWTHFRRDDFSGDVHRWEDQPIAGYGGTAVDQIGLPGDVSEAYYAWGNSHAPQVGFLAYLVTGAKFWCDEAIMQGVYTGQSLVPGWRTGLASGNLNITTGLNMVIWEDSAIQPRGAAWAHRTMACAACACPDNHPNRADFIGSLVKTATFTLDACVRGTSWLGAPMVNDLGILPQTHGTSTSYGTPLMESFVNASWMECFWTAAIGYAWDLTEDMLTPSERAEVLAARDYAYKWPVGLAGAYPGGWCWRLCGQGAIAMTKGRPWPAVGRTSRFHNSFAEMYLHHQEYKCGNHSYNGASVIDGPINGTSQAVSGSTQNARRFIVWVEGKWIDGTTTPMAWAATVTLQRSTDNATWEDVKTWTENTVEYFDDGLTGTIYYRLVVKAGEYTSGQLKMWVVYGSVFVPVERFWQNGIVSCAAGESIWNYTYETWIDYSSYFANYIPALAYARTHNAPGAVEAWERVTNASNAADFMSDSSTYRNNPVWGIRARLQ